MRSKSIKCICLSAFVTLSSYAYAYDFKNFYIGGDIGIANLVDKESTGYPNIAYHHLGATGLVGGGLVGYDFSILERFNLGLEWFMNATALNDSAYQFYPKPNGVSPTYNAHMQYNLGFRGLPGYAFNSTTIGYIVLGYAYGKFNIQDNGDYGFVSSNITESGFQSGAGIKTQIWNNFYIRTDILYTTYTPSNVNGIATNNQGNPGTLSINYSNSFSTLEADVTFMYKFN
ncbi:MAG: hypothetical protein EBQ95_04590 [Gammaproteobacteria bacterium]|nr:hypothetical protein [Gammaproteobacteria bacterium]